MSQSNLDVARRAYDAFGRGDIPGVMSLLDPDVEWNAPDVLPHGMRTRGHAGVGEFFSGLASLWEGLSLEIEDMLANETKVVTQGRASGDLGGHRTGYGFIHVMTVRDERVVRLDEYVAPPEGGFPA